MIDYIDRIDVVFKIVNKNKSFYLCKTINKTPSVLLYHKEKIKEKRIPFFEFVHCHVFRSFCNEEHAIGDIIIVTYDFYVQNKSHFVAKSIKLKLATCADMA